MEEQQLAKLTQQIDKLIERAVALDKENRLLKAAAHNWQHERKRLLDQHDQARSKLESTIRRLEHMVGDAHITKTPANG